MKIVIKRYIEKYKYRRCLYSIHLFSLRESLSYLFDRLNLSLWVLKMEKCNICEEYRKFIGIDGICIFCETPVKGKVIKNKTGSLDENIWMR